MKPDPPSPPRGSNPVLLFMGLFLMLAFAAAVFYPVYLASLPPRKVTTCLGNFKQIGMSSLLYASDHDGLLPRAQWIDGLLPYMKNEKLFTCPEVAEEQKLYGYSLNFAVSGGNSDKLAQSLPLFFETDALGRSVVANLAAISRHRHDMRGDGGGSVICKVDSSCRFVHTKDLP